MASEKQIEANKQNALKSTGPKSIDGKAKVSQNDIRHGIFSNELVIQKGEGKENKLEFDKLLADLSVDLMPEGKKGQFTGILNIRDSLSQVIGSLSAGIMATAISGVVTRPIAWIFLLTPFFFHWKYPFTNKG